jgi:hypothetical protein
MAPPGIKCESFWLVEQYLNQMCPNKQFDCGNEKAVHEASNIYKLLSVKANACKMWSRCITMYQYVFWRE